VLYQLSYCGGPDGAFGNGLKTLAPDNGRRPFLQEKRSLQEKHACLSGI
jgi:hypothetical protein